VSQNNNFAYHVEERKKLFGLVGYYPTTSQCSALAGSRRIGVKTAKPGVD